MAASPCLAPPHTTPVACPYTSYSPLPSSAVSLPIEGRTLAVQPLRRHLPPRRPAPPSPSSYSSSVSPSTDASSPSSHSSSVPPSTNASLAIQICLPGRPDLPPLPASCLISLPVQRLPLPSKSRRTTTKAEQRGTWILSRKTKNGGSLYNFFIKNVESLAENSPVAAICSLFSTLFLRLKQLCFVVLLKGLSATAMEYYSRHLSM